MAKSDNIVVRGLKGKFGEDIVFKTRKNGETYATKAPDRSNVKPSKEQRKDRRKFSKAVKFAQEIMKDPEKSARINVKADKTLYHTAIRKYLNADKKDPFFKIASELYTDKYLSTLKLNARQIKVVQWLRKRKAITNGQYMKLNKTSKPTATRDLQELVKRGILGFSGAKGAGASYSLKAPSIGSKSAE